MEFPSVSLVEYDVTSSSDLEEEELEATSYLSSDSDTGSRVSPPENVVAEESKPAKRPRLNEHPIVVIVDSSDAESDQEGERSPAAIGLLACQAQTSESSASDDSDNEQPPSTSAKTTSQPPAQDSEVLSSDDSKSESDEQRQAQSSGDDSDADTTASSAAVSESESDEPAAPAASSQDSPERQVQNSPETEEPVNLEKRAYALKMFELPVDVREFLEATKQFFTKHTSLERRGQSLAASTFAKTSERLLCKLKKQISCGRFWARFHLCIYEADFSLFLYCRLSWIRPTKLGSTGNFDQRGLPGRAALGIVPRILKGMLQFSLCLYLQPKRANAQNTRTPEKGHGNQFVYGPAGFER